MKPLEIIFLVLALHFSLNKCQQLSLIGSHFVPIDSKYTAFLYSKDVKANSETNITLKAPGFENSKIIRTFKEGEEKIEFEIPKTPHPLYELHIVHKNADDGSCTEQSVKLISMSRRPVILIQLNKPVYNAGDEIKFRVFVLSQKLLPHKEIDQISVTIFDGAGNTQRKFSKIKTSEFGVYENLAKISEAPFLGKWTIEVEVDGKKRLKKFDVQKIDENSIEVDIDMNKKVPYESKKFFLAIKVKQPKESFFLGNITVTASGNFMKDGKNNQISHIKNVNLNSVTKTLEFDIEEDLKIVLPDKNTEIKFQIEIVDLNGKKIFSKDTKTLVMGKKEEKGVKLLRNKYFRPGMKFPIKIEIKSLGDDLDSIFDILKLNLKFYKRNNQTKEKTTPIKVLKTTIVTFFIPPMDTVKVDINIQFNKEKLSETVKIIPSYCTDEFIQAGFVKRGEAVGNITKISVDTTAKFETLHALIISENGIVYSNEFPDAVDKKNFEISFPVTEMMFPRSNFIVYYIRQRDGVVIHDYIPLVFEASVDSSMKLVTSDTAKATQQANINIEAASDSMVFLSSNDQCSTQGNEILENSIVDEIFGYRHLKFSKSSHYEINNLGAFVVEPLTASPCNEIHRSKIGIFKDDGEKLTFKPEGSVSNYFPDVWFHDSFKVSSTNHSYTEQTPFASTTWKIAAIAMHPTTGLSIAQSQREISVQNDILPIIKAPPVVHVGEAFNFEYSVSNLEEVSFYADVSIKIENSHFMQSHKVFNNAYVYVGNCLAFSKQTQTKTEQIQLPARGVSNAQTFTVSPDNLGTMSIKIEVVIGNIRVNTEKIISVRNLEIMGMEKISSHLIDGSSAPVSISLSAGKNFISIYGNLLGSVLKNAESIFGSQLPSDELKVSKLAASVIAYKYLIFSEESAENKLNEIWLNYQESIGVLQKILLRKDPLDLKLATFIAQVFIDTQAVIEIGTHSIQKCLEFIKTHQQDDGSFPFKANDEIRNEIGFEQSKSHLIATLSLLAFISDQNLKKNFQNEIKKTIEYLQSKNDSFSTDYEKAIAAYAFVLNNDQDTSKKLLIKISRSLSSLTDQKYKAMDTETVSYTVLTKILLGMDPHNEIKWLMEQRNVDGGFYSSHDTVLGLKAINEFTKYKNIKKINLGVKMNQRSMLQMSYVLDERFEEISGSSLSLQISGSGYGYAVIYHESDLTNKSQINYFGMTHEISVPKANEIKLAIKFSPGPSSLQDTKLVIVKAQLPRGYKYIKHEGSKNIMKADTQNDGNLVILFVSEMESTHSYNFIINAVKSLEFYNHEKGSIKVYDHNRPNLEYLQFYKYDFNGDTCDNDKKAEEEIIKKRLEEEERRKAEARRLEQERLEKQRQERERRKAEEERKEREKLKAEIAKLEQEKLRTAEERKREIEKLNAEILRQMEQRKKMEIERNAQERKRMEEERQERERERQRIAEAERRERERKEREAIRLENERIEQIKEQRRLIVMRAQQEQREKHEREQREERERRRRQAASYIMEKFNLKEIDRCKGFWCWGCTCNLVSSFTLYSTDTRFHQRFGYFERDV